MDDKPRPWRALLLVFGAQVLISFVSAIAPVIAVDMAPRIGLGAERIGVFTALTYLCAIVGGLLVGPWITWLGPVRSIQVMLLSAALGALLGSLATLPGLLLAALFLGVSLGFPHPVFTAILGRHAPKRSMGLFLSFRFAAAPIGIALAGLIIPAAAAAIGERGAIAAAAAACALAALAVGRAIKALDWRDAERPRRLGVTLSIRAVLEHPPTRRLAFVCMVYAMVQQAYLAYAVLLLVGLSLSLKTAASLLAISQLVSVLGRVAIGHASDQWVTPKRMLAVYGVAMGVACAALAALPTSPKLMAAGGVMALIAATAMGWPGLMTAQLLRVVPSEHIARFSSGNQVFIFSGAVLGPFLLARLLAHGGSYAAAFIGLGGLAVVAGVSMLRDEPLRHAGMRQPGAD